MTYTIPELNMILSILDQPSGAKFLLYADGTDEKLLTGEIITNLRDELFITAIPNCYDVDGKAITYACTVLPRGELLVKTKSMHADDRPTWLNEFPDMDEVAILDDTIHDKWYGDSTWTDTSWHNDACPSFESYDLLAGKAIKIWSDYKNEDHRESPAEEQYSVNIYTVDGEGDDMTSDELIDTVLVTNKREDVYDWILAQEVKNEFARREAEAEKNRIADLAMKGLRAPTLEDMIASKKLSRDIDGDIGAGIPELKNVTGFIYFGSYYIYITDKGQFTTEASNDGCLTDTLNEAEIWLWDNFVCGEANPIKLGEEFTVIGREIVDYAIKIFAKTAQDACVLARDIPQSAYTRRSPEGDNFFIHDVE